MLTKLIIRNFKRFDNVEIELGNPVVFVGPNNYGKTTALQALSLWDIGLRKWLEKRKNVTAPERRPGVTINRRDLVVIPIPSATQIWKDLRVREVYVKDKKQFIENIRIDIIVEGVTKDKFWECGLEFDYANEEALYCRPLRISKDGNHIIRMKIPEEVYELKVAFLPPMSGLSSNEIILKHGAISVRIGEGRTAEVLRNLCYEISQNEKIWQDLVGNIHSLFGVRLNKPEFIIERGELIMSYSDLSGAKLDISAAGRGLHQTLLLLSYIYANPNSILLLDEPDAHLEILRQRQTYHLISEIAKKNNNQLIIASHSEILLNEAAEKDVLIAFLEKPYRVDDRGSQIKKSLTTINWEDYHLAKQMGWALYLEGSTDLAILKSFAEILDHKAKKYLEAPFVKYVGNHPKDCEEHFYGVKEGYDKLKGIAIFDRLDRELDKREDLIMCCWKRKEIESYLCSSETLIAYARSETIEGDLINYPLFSKNERDKRVGIMMSLIDEFEKAFKTIGKGDPFSPDLKVSDEFLNPLFKRYFEELELPNMMRKTNFHILAKYVPVSLIDEEIIEKLDRIAETAEKAESIMKNF
ncbi:MAG: AAA family ATPase [candidate division Zixibacteria bacterium]|nr:AAA family ATPase [Candidatus Tariuqbacter arcticus]